MEIQFVSREYIIDYLLDLMNSQEGLTEDQLEFLTNLTNNKGN